MHEYSLFTNIAQQTVSSTEHCWLQWSVNKAPYNNQSHIYNTHRNSEEETEFTQ